MAHPRNMGRPGRIGLTAGQLAQWVDELPLLSPPAMSQRLEEQGYCGQQLPRRALCLLAYRHVRRIKHIYVNGVSAETLPPKTNYLLMGPTGCGKTHLVELLFRELLGLPTVVVDVTNLSETGYVGQDTVTVITRLLHEAADEPTIAQIGLVCLDEFDKLASGQNNAIFAGAGTTKDVSGRGVQRELLKMLETAEIAVPLELTHSSYAEQVVVNTRDIAFVACGAFSGYQQLVRHRRSAERIGFGRGSADAQIPGPDDVAVSLTEEEVDDLASLQSYGFMPELIARFGRVVPFAALDADTLAQIVRRNYLPRYVNEFAHEGYALEVEDAFLDRLVKSAIKRQTGARGLASELQRALEGAAYDAFPGPTDGGGRVKVSVTDGQVVIQVDGN